MPYQRALVHRLSFEHGTFWLCDHCYTPLKAFMPRQVNSFISIHFYVIDMLLTVVLWSRCHIIIEQDLMLYKLFLYQGEIQNHWLFVYLFVWLFVLVFEAHLLLIIKGTCSFKSYVNILIMRINALPKDTSQLTWFECWFYKDSTHSHITIMVIMRRIHAHHERLTTLYCIAAYLLTNLFE